MEPTSKTRPSRKLHGFTPFRGMPVDRNLRNDFMDFYDGNELPETTPFLNIREDKNNYILELAAPGLNREDFNVTVDEDILTVSSEKETEYKSKEDEGESSCTEFNYSSFSRSVTLPEHADTSKINARYENGILNLTIPKKPEALKNTSQKINVQ